MIKRLKKMPAFIPLFFFIVSFQNTHALEITGKAAEAYLSGEYNRGENYAGSFSLLGELGLNNMFNIRGGLSFGRAAEAMDLKAFATTRFSFFSNIPLQFSLSWKYSGLFLYETHTHTILPVITYGTDKAGASVGVNFRFTSFFGEPPEPEMVISYLFYINIVNGEILRLGISLGNFDDFYAKNAAAFTFNFNTVVRIDSNWTIINKIEIMQSGFDSLAVNFYGFSWKGGARFTW